MSKTVFTVLRKAFGLGLVVAALSGAAFAGARCPAVPEIDPGSALSALTLLGGGLMLLTDRKAAR